MSRRIENKIIIGLLLLIVGTVGYYMLEDYNRENRIKALKYDNIQLQHEVNQIDRYLELCEKMNNC